MDHSERINKESTVDSSSLLSLCSKEKQGIARKDERKVQVSSSPLMNEGMKERNMPSNVSVHAPPSDIPVVDLLSPSTLPSKKYIDPTNASMRSGSVSGRTDLSGILSLDAADSDSNRLNSACSLLAMSSNVDESLKRSQSFEDNMLGNNVRITKQVKVNNSSAPLNVSKKISYGIKSTLSFELLLHRFKAWNKCLSYKPIKKCVPADTYLVIVVTNPVDSILLKSFKDGEACDADVARYLSITKVVLIPRPGIGEVMGYCI
jgi:hypothetical protein